MKRFLCHLWAAMRWGDWYCGWELWEGKPRFGLFHLYYDGWRLCFHAGPLYLEVDYPPV